MSQTNSDQKVCVIIGASHGGINFAFALRKEGWSGKIVIFDKDPVLPYHRPPLSKAYLTSDDAINKNLLKSEESYSKSEIDLSLGVTVRKIDRLNKTISLDDNIEHKYDKLVLATGARPIIPGIKGLKEASNVFCLRTANDVEQIRIAVAKSVEKRIVVIGGGYIGLETAASLKKIGASVTILEREPRILARVTAPEMSQFFEKLHASNNVAVLTNKNVTTVTTANNVNKVLCVDGSSYDADIIIVGVGIHVNLELAQEAGLEIENGIKVDGTTKTNDNDIYAIGDCTYHFNIHYNRFIRLESVQNAVDQAKVAAAAICEKEALYNSIPWFWSDQYDVKLQMVGLGAGYTNVIVREEKDTEQTKFSIWYFKGEELLAVDAVNNAKAYVLGTKFIKNKNTINQANLIDSSIEFKAVNFIVE